VTQLQKDAYVVCRNRRHHSSQTAT
jgi:hypothetical protein